MPLKPIKTNPRIEVIKNDPEKATMYAIYVLKRRWPAAEPIISKHRDFAIEYIEKLIHDKWPEAEPYVKDDAYTAYNYAAVTGKRFIEGEPAIKTNPIYAYNYAKYILKHRWPEAEDVIKQSGVWWLDYQMTFRNEFKKKKK